ncbi:MAG: alpha-L-fucosidase [Bacteroidales bacterium]|nr:alpha-L-fucosidase [Bacteroidales bacterium]
MKHQPALLFLIILFAGCGVEPPTPYGVCPTAAQLRWQRMETNMFCHFGPNTFSGLEWGEGSETEDMFNPTQLDCDQWAVVAKAAGMKGIILTAKHHDGFCLWPNPVSDHTVAQSSWQEGKGDVLRELSNACHKSGIKFGIYISPWDRNAPTYGTPQYNETFRLTLENALSNYGDIYEQWFDGANGEGPNGKRQVYDWQLFNSTVARLQPQAVIFSDVGPGCRWVGNEEGCSGETCWSRINTEGYEPGAKSPSTDVLNQGQPDGERWVPAETDVSIRPGWFYHSDEQPKSLQQLLKIYYTSVGRNSLLLLNVPPDTRGLIPAADSLRLVELRSALDSIFSNDLAHNAHVTASDSRGHRFRPSNVTDTHYHRYWAVGDTCLTPTITLTFNHPATFNRVMLQEYIPLGQRVAQFEVEVLQGDKWHPLSQGTTIGYKRILLTKETTASAVRIHFTHCLACPVINRIALYKDDIFVE